MYKFYEKPKTFEEFKSTINHYYENEFKNGQEFMKWLNSEEFEPDLRDIYRDSMRGDDYSHWRTVTQCIELMY